MATSGRLTGVRSECSLEGKESIGSKLGNNDKESEV